MASEILAAASELAEVQLPCRVPAKTPATRLRSAPGRSLRHDG